MRAAVERVAPSVVAVETVGGLARVDQVQFGGGASTGLIVSSDGYIVTSAFAFAQKPASVLVSLADGTRLPATLVATDHSRLVSLLKVTVDRPLPTPAAVEKNDIQVGWWAIAVGRAFDVGQTNVSVGIVSAVDRIAGRVVQTDAKVSPSNYGGPLVDIRGRVMGVLTPLSPTKSAQLAGVEWYDSGIGFAVPLADVERVLPRLREGHDLQPGLMGISLEAGDLHADAPVIAACRPKSPAHEAGLKPGDRIVEIDQQPVSRQSQLLDEINRRYAGDRLRMVIIRGEERLERELELVDHLDPYQRAFLGILPRRSEVVTAAKEASVPDGSKDASEKDRAPAQPAGVAIRFVYPDSPAAEAGLQPGDVIVSLSAKPVNSRDDLMEIAAAAEVGQSTSIEIRRGDQSLKHNFVWHTVPEEVPGELPPEDKADPLEAKRPATGKTSLKVAEFKNDSMVYVPENYTTGTGHALVVWLRAADAASDDDALLSRWKERCRRGGVILFAPRPAETSGWQRDDFEFIRKAVEQLRTTYDLDMSRVVAAGGERGGALAYALAFHWRDVVRGVLAIQAQPGGAPLDNDPVYRLDFYLTTNARARFADDTARLIEALRERKYAVTVREQAEPTGDLTDDEAAEFLRWLDSLDKV